MQVITIYDYLLLPIYLLLFYFIVLKRAQKNNGTILKKIFITAFFLKMGGVILYSMVVQYYYGYGDSFGYYMGGSFIRKIVGESPDFLNNFFLSGAELSAASSKYNVETETSAAMANIGNVTVMKISAVLSYLSFNYYLIISLFFGFFSFIGSWKLFCVFNDILKGRSVKLLAYATLYLPSLWFWGSGLLKESVCMGALGLIVSVLYKNIVKKKFSFKDIFILGINFYLLFIIKNYIAGILLTSVAASLVFYFIIARSGFFSKLVTTLVTVIIGIAIFSLTVSDYLDSLVDESASFIEISKTVYATDVEDGSLGGFAAGDFDLSLRGLIMKAPSAVFDTLYRPFLWETKKPMMLLSAVESFLMLLAILFVLIKLRFFRFFTVIFSNPYLVFCLVFSILMGAVVGLTTFNFGTLVRYRLPLLPFYGFLLIATYILGSYEKKQVPVQPAVDE